METIISKYKYFMLDWFFVNRNMIQVTFYKIHHDSKLVAYIFLSNLTERFYYHFINSKFIRINFQLQPHRYFQK